MFYYGSVEEPIAKLEQRLPIRRLAAIVSSISCFSFVDFIICPATSGNERWVGMARWVGILCLNSQRPTAIWSFEYRISCLILRPQGVESPRHINTVLPDSQDQSVYMPSSLIPKKNKSKLTNLKKFIVRS